MELCEDIRQTQGMKDLYSLRKETIERIFGSAKENHGFRYTQLVGKARMEMKVGLTFACMNLKKLAKLKGKRWLLEKKQLFQSFIWDTICLIREKHLWKVHPGAVSLRLHKHMTNCRDTLADWRLFFRVHFAISLFS